MSGKRTVGQLAENPQLAREARAGEEFREVGDRLDRLPSEIIRRLCTINSAKSALAVLQTFGVIAAALWVATTWWSIGAVVIAFVVIVTRQQALFVLAHDAAHYRLFKHRGWNDVVGRLCASVVGISMCTYRVVHRLHHNHLYEARDPDIPLHAGYPRGRGYLIKKLLGDLTGKTAWKTYRYFFGAPVVNDEVGDENRPLTYTSAKLRRAARQDRWVVAGVQTALLGGAVFTGYGLEYAVLWLLPALTVLQSMLRFRAICEHGAVTDFGSPKSAARTNLGHPVLLWALFPHHVNYHIEHHMYPAIPHYNLAACHRELKARGLLAGAEVRGLGNTAAMVFGPPAALRS